MQRLVPFVLLLPLLACSRPSLILRQVESPPALVRDGLRLSVRFWDRRRSARFLRLVHKGKSVRTRRRERSKAAPYLSVFPFEFSVQRTNILLAGLELTTARLILPGTNAHPEQALGFSALEKQFPPAFYRSAAYQQLLVGRLLGNKNRTRLRIYPVCTIIPNQKVRGFLLLPRFPYTARQATLKVDGFYYKSAWEKVRVRFQFPLRLSVRRITP